jgi:N-acetylglucosaminyldiphosphoundecaprenol N-acetyl-beta-D-mannosaminyltransferase
MLAAGRQVREEPTSTPAPLNITGIPVVPFETYEQVLDCVEQRIESARKSFCVAINPIKMYKAWHDPELLMLLRQADIGICDGVGVSIASRILYGRSIRRITGCDLFFRLLGLASEKKYGVFLLGASAQANAAAREALQKTYPDLRIVGWHDGYFQDSQKVVEEINASGADLLFVAMGSPKQEQWIGRHRQSINAGFCMGVGGSFDIAAGSLRRAPKIFRMTGTEFLFRFALEPRKRLVQQKILMCFLLRVLGRKLFGAHESIGWAEDL